MAYLRKSDFTTKSVTSSLMLHKGGVAGPGTYTRRAKNMIESPKLLRRMADAGAAMRASCSLSDHCTGNPSLVGKMAPDGKPYKACDIAERKARLEAARACAKATLPTV